MLDRELTTGAFDRFRSMPIWRLAPVVGGLIGDVGRYLLASSPGDRPRPDHGLPCRGRPARRARRGWLRAFADANPISHLATAARGLMQGGAHPGDVLWVLGASAALVALFAPLSAHLYRRHG